MKKWYALLLLVSTVNLCAMEDLDTEDDQDTNQVILIDGSHIGRKAFEKTYENLCHFMEEDQKDIETLFACASSEADVADLSKDARAYHYCFFDAYGQLRRPALLIISCAFWKDFRGELVLKPAKKICKPNPVISSDEVSDDDDDEDYIPSQTSDDEDDEESNNS